MADLLIVDDEKGYLKVLKIVFEAEGYSVRTAGNGKEALDALRQAPADVIVSDVKMPDMNGIELLREARDLFPDIGVILMTAFGTVETAREAFKLGADDFIQKPFQNDELKLIVKRALDRQSLVRENRAFRIAQRMTGSIRNIVGNSIEMQKVFSMIETVAKEPSTVLITGESGTGKELVARAIHDLSDRSDKPFIPVNCGAIPENLLEAELFGYVKGAFTGAATNQRGLFEAANGGSILLDEIGEMPLAMQVKILRVLQEQRIKPVGSTTEVAIDVRVIAATNSDVRQMVDEGTFRQDLFYRLSVIPIHLPSLREHRSDIPALVEHFVGRFSAKAGKRVAISAGTVKVLSAREWPGNVRELEHTIERAVALTRDGGEISEDLCADSRRQPTAQTSVALLSMGSNLNAYLSEIERTMVEEALMQSGGNQRKAAELLGIAAHALRHLMSKHGLKSKD